ncbi:unnamed protein product [Symbiodinium natans]|uniref:Uncharacterized protein n=1 Tax=Symbiodinium natans TaxID=878477 RepID=A0A812UNH7_9DINO|nr:unnamed protein product [Symbiodinium natans]
MDFASRLSAVQAELAEVRAVKDGGNYLGISGSDLASYAEELQEKEQLLHQITSAQAGPIRQPPKGPASTFDRCQLPSVVQHLVDYEAVPYEATKALRALASLAYNEPLEVVRSPRCVEQMLRVLRLHRDRDTLQVMALRCFCHLCFSAEAVRALPSEVLPALLEQATEETSKLAHEAMARILVAEAERADANTPRLSPELFRLQAKLYGQLISLEGPGRTPFKDMLLRLAGELVQAKYIASQFLAAAPVTENAEEMALGWLAMLQQLLATDGELSEALVVPGIAMAATSVMDMHGAALSVQSQGIAALAGLARRRRGPMAIAEASGVRRAETALGMHEDASLQMSCISFLVSVLDWPLPAQKLCDVDFARVVMLTKEAMRRHVEATALQVLALSSLARLLEVLVCRDEVKASGGEGLIKTILAHHKDNEQVWTWGRIVLDSLGADRHWTYRN